MMVMSSQQALYLPGDSIKYDCPDGYHLSGSAVRLCRSDYTWSGQPAECYAGKVKFGASQCPLFVRFFLEICVLLFFS